jgi:orotate phosphoribosyltransferase
VNEAELHDLLERHGGILHGHFKLSSGRHSDVFLQTALVLKQPHLAERLGHELGSRFANAGATVVLAPAMAGLIIGHEVARHLGIPMLFCERVDGSLELRRGFELSSTDRVLIIDNAVTDGLSKREVIELARKHDAEVVGVGVVVSRTGTIALGVPFQTLLTLPTTDWEPESCPLCAKGSAPTAPGSRHLVR